ncbi:AraC family transcriptional regulator [Streptomyces lunaelactis]|uniref:AraC family transcriptional regulator n=1 Tax=Streptomyces lunaelactis TaxID=1535768 RepID=UPI0015856F41|nr:AraC family transcriptional regulator [Streptomyces lunaelactis]NUK04671.1 AraC family transcriptional regulator [Streptomyces lunaelactis]NUK19574.1 AraC family transcriptional regulator [Streptomyces lunaelactis]NUK38750.1 AraC family transcriptional regulator [Streptomyces lunaelactis]NUK45146.1 AraC family transcriptional regulator [Streptomyces lunaelactis]NUK55047.1 AraC family transcriptional regulator [Streptomyces lunaelactis]
MDALAGLLDGPRARGAFLLRMVMEPPWSVRIEDHAPLTLMCVSAGEAWIVPDSGDPVVLRPGDVAIARGPDCYTTADEPTREPMALIGPGGTCHTLQGEPLAESMHLGVRSWGNDPEGSATVLVGTYQMEGEVSGRLLDALPQLLHLPADVWDCPLLPVLDDEISRDDPGQSVVLDRILDLVLIAALRSWFSRPDAKAPAWYVAMGDPVVGRALRLLHDDPAHPWTVALLAAKCGVSRAGLARRFNELVGEPPMAYLTGWRLALAADLLRETDATVEAVARKVGYSGSFALSAAFKRVRGVSPREHRTGALLRERQQHLP